MLLKLLRIATLILAPLAGLVPATAQDAAEKPILLVDGRTTAGKSEFTRSELEGVPLARLMAHVGASGTKVQVVALNRYKTEIPVADFAAQGAILALKRNGQYMEVRDKGPLFVIYPFDAKPDLKSELYYGRSAWQVRSITVE